MTKWNWDLLHPHEVLSLSAVYTFNSQDVSSQTSALSVCLSVFLSASGVSALNRLMIKSTYYLLEMMRIRVDVGSYRREMNIDDDYEAIAHLYPKHRTAVSTERAQDVAQLSR